MMEKKINAGGVNGLGEGLINTNGKDFKHLQQMIKELSSNEEFEQRVENQFLSVRFQMESYLNSEQSEIKPAGSFLEQFLKIIGVKKKDFARYIDFEPSNLTAVLKGRRKVNSEMAIKLGQIFKLNPVIWLHIESKNELTRELSSQTVDYNQYSLVDLMKKAG